MRPAFVSSGKGEEMTFGTFCFHFDSSGSIHLTGRFFGPGGVDISIDHRDLRGDTFRRLLQRAGFEFDPTLKINIDLYTNNGLLLRLRRSSHHESKRSHGES
jgi:hypothetical protein